MASDGLAGGRGRGLDELAASGSSPFAHRGLGFGADRLGGDRTLGLDRRQAQGVGNDKTAVDERPGHLARGRRVTVAHHVTQMDHVIERKKLIVPELRLY